MRSVGASRAAANVARARGFSILDVMVTISVIAVLIALLMPALGGVRETTHRVVCSSNVRQFGLGIAMFAEANRDRMPYSRHTARPQETIWLRTKAEPGRGPWDGLGILFQEEYLPTPEVFYCPSHSGAHPFEEYADEWGSDLGYIAGNYQYRAQAPGEQYLSAILPRSTALVSDGLRTQSDFNHRVGANVLKADLSVFFFWDPEGNLFNSLPSVEGEVQAEPVTRAWDLIDKSSSGAQ